MHYRYENPSINSDENSNEEYSSNESNNSNFENTGYKSIQKQINRYNQINPNQPIEYPFHTLKKEMGIYKTSTDFKSNDMLEFQYIGGLAARLRINQITEETYDYILAIHRFKKLLMFPAFITGNGKTTLHHLQDSIREVYKQFVKIHGNKDDGLNHLWFYYNDRSVKILDLVVSIYGEYIEKVAPVESKPYVKHNKKIILQFIHYLILDGGADTSNLRQKIKAKVLNNFDLTRTLYDSIMQLHKRLFPTDKPLEHIKYTKNRVNMNTQKKIWTNAKQTLKNRMPDPVVRHIFGYTKS